MNVCNVAKHGDTEMSGCGRSDPWVSGRPCYRLNPERNPYGVPKDDCPCERNKRILKFACGYIAFMDCIKSGVQKKKVLSLTFNRGIKGIYTPIRLTLYPLYLMITLHMPHFIHIKIGKLCRFAKFTFQIKDWDIAFGKMK